jgi:hypothetical protein
VGPMLIIVEPPGFDDLLGLGHRGELVYVQTFISQASVKGFKQGIFHGFARANKVELHAPTIGPIFECPRLELGAMLHRERAWAVRPLPRSIEDLADHLTRHPNTGLKDRTVATPVIDDRQDPKWPSIGHGIMHNIPTPPLSWSRWRGSGASVQRARLATLDPQAELQTLPSIAPSPPRAIHEPAVAS